MNAPQPPNRPAWQIETTHPDLYGKLKEALQEIVDPEIGLNEIQLGLVRDVVVNADNAILTMILTTPFCPYGPAMLETTRKKAEEALNLPVTIAYGDEVWDFAMLEEGVDLGWGLY
jgi:metal-sulfur cluster biosynthetic enzyme